MTDTFGLLGELVAIPSVSGDERAIADFTAELLGGRGLDVERVGQSVVARLSLGRGPRLLLNTHLDTVPIGEGWTREPAGELDGERLYGRGSNDAKASVAAMIGALLDLADRRAELPAGEVTLALNEREETTNGGMELVLGRIGRPDGAVTGEPTGLEVVRAQSGLVVVEARWFGRSCHAAHVARVEHASALTAAARDLAGIDSWLQVGGEHPLLGISTVAPTVLTSGDRHNVVPAAARAVFDARVAPPLTGDDVLALLAERLPSAELSLRSDRLRPVETPGGHPLVAAALKCAGREAPIGSATLSDMALLAGVPAVKCGPGETARSHTPDEWVARAEVEAGRAFYTALVPRALEALALEETAR